MAGQKGQCAGLGDVIETRRGRAVARGVVNRNRSIGSKFPKNRDEHRAAAFGHVSNVGAETDRARGLRTSGEIAAENGGDYGPHRQSGLVPGQKSRP